MVVGFVGSLELVLGLTGVDTLQDRQSTEVLKCELQLADGLGAGQILGLLSLSSLLYSLSHYFICLFNIKI